VGGGILTHGVPFLHHAGEQIAENAKNVPTVGGLLAVLGPTALDLGVGVAAGAVILLVVSGAKRLVRGKKAATTDS